MSRANTAPTHLSLSGYARTMGLDPMHFCGGASKLRPEPVCSDVWYQYNWQNPKIVSREQIAFRLWEAERDLADALRYHLAPTWIEGESVAYTHPQRPELYGVGVDVRMRLKSVQTKYGYVIEGGTRATELLGDDVTWLPVDADGDGFTELAEFQLTVPATLDPCEVHAYLKEYDEADARNSRTDIASTGADPAWEVQPLRTHLSGTTLTIYIRTWELFRPQLQEALSVKPIPADDFGTGLDPTDLGSYVDALSFYRVYNDPSTQVQFTWDERMCATTACEGDVQTGCLVVKDTRNGLVILQPSVYNEVEGTFTPANWTGAVEPDSARVWYRAGLVPSHPTRGCQVLDPYWAKTIAMLTTARLEYPLCNCTNVREVSDFWRRDVSMIIEERSFQVTPAELQNPFGTRIGEILAWRNVCARGRKRGQAILT